MALNITPQIPQVIVNAAAPTTEALQRTNAQKEVVPAPVQVEAAVPQKSREQDARPTNNSAAGDITYDNIFKNQDKVIPEDANEQGQSDQQSGQGANQDSGEQASQASSQSSRSDDESDTGVSNAAGSGNESNPVTASTEEGEQTTRADGQSSESSSEEAEQAERQAQQQVDQREKELERVERQEIRELEARDQEVRAHELAHAAVGGAYAGAPSYDYQTGPNGKKYAVGGEVQIDVSKEANPQDTIEKMQTVRAAALAPAEPSSQDRKVAAEASQNIAEARMEMLQENAEQREATAANVSSRFEERDENVSRVADVVAAKYQNSYQAGNDVQSGFSTVA